MCSAIVALTVLVAGFATPVMAGNDYEGGRLGIDRQKVERPQGEQVGQRPNRPVAQPSVDSPRERRSERRHERREERYVDRHQEHRMDRIERYEERRRMDRHEQHRDHRSYRAPAWRGDIRYFDRDDSYRWRRGAWRHVRHEGRLGWWWVVGGGSWYFYSQPVYPYPDPYVPPGYFYSQPEYPYFDPYIPPVVIMQSEPVESTPGIVVAPAATSQYWYYCESKNGYYPYAASCPEGWKAVLATPAPAQ